MAQVHPDNKNIKLFEKGYVGFNVREGQGEEIPLGFLTPDGTDAAAQKRKDTVDRWASGSRRKIPATIIDNIPRVGFALGKTVRHGYGWNSGIDKVRIDDPNGFQLEITTANLVQILGCTTVQEGEILDACVWGRLGKDNILVPVSSDVYKAATANTERMNSKASLKDINPGDHIVMQNGTEGKYLGDFFVVEIQGSYHSEDYECKCSNKKKMIIQRKDGECEIIGSPKLSSFVLGERISLEQGRDIFNDKNHDKKALIKPLMSKEFSLIKVPEPTEYLTLVNPYGREHYFIYNNGRFGRFSNRTYYSAVCYVQYLSEHELVKGRMHWDRCTTNHHHSSSPQAYQQYQITDYGRKDADVVDPATINQWFRLQVKLTDKDDHIIETLI